MAEISAIEWTDATVNFWWGCTNVSPGCDNCYAETWNAFRGTGEWGPGAARRPIKGSAALLRKLQSSAPAFESLHGRPRRVFMQSLSDTFDNEVEDVWRMAVFSGIEAADRIRVQLLTKRIGNVEKMVLDTWRNGGWPRHVGLMITVVNQREASRDIPKLIALKKRLGIPWIGLSIEPMLEPIDISKWAADLDWIIVGGESGKNARPMHPAWVAQVQQACQRAGTAFFFKQWGEWLPEGEAPFETFAELRRKRAERVELHADPNPFASVRFDTRTMYRAGKKTSGKLLNGSVSQAFPKELAA
ncbi:protein gp37 [Neorhizobium galegae]|uniref:DUF5131 family protein n=1 Tax=Neorhizobium galegae TaxID=399 RepID=UPI00278B977D|nr:DUF5131 family protein [Neorhizobium galegae]MDQ0135721.1 protein gp37 [Neorhizobium galegae]